MNEQVKDRDYFVSQLRDYHQKVAEWIKQTLAPDDDDDYEQSPDYQQALEYYRAFKKQDEVDYSVVIAYARELHEKYDKTDKVLDEKADSIIKYLGGGSALVTFGALVSIKAENPWSCILGGVALVCLLPALACAINAVRHAIHVRRPRSAATLPHVKFAVEMAEYNKKKEDIELNLWLIFYPICEAAHHRNVQKAKRVEKAHKAYVWAMGFLIIPVVAIAICLAVAASQIEKSGPKDQNIKTVHKP
jgi:hypothetical protein